MLTTVDYKNKKFKESITTNLNMTLKESQAFLILSNWKDCTAIRNHQQQYGKHYSRSNDPAANVTSGCES